MHKVLVRALGLVAIFCLLVVAGVGALWIISPPKMAHASCTGQFAANQECGTGSSAGTPGPQNRPVFNLESYCPTTTATTCFQAAITATQAVGGILNVSKRGYQYTDEPSITAPMMMTCAPGDVNSLATFTKTVTTGKKLRINSGYVQIVGCTFSRSGVPDAASEGITIGDTVVRLTDASFTASSTTMTTSQATCSASSIGMRVMANSVGPGPGPLFTSVAGCLSGSQFTLSNAASFTGSPISTGLGFDYQEISLDRVTVYNDANPLHIYAATQYHLINGYYLGSGAFRRRQLLWGDMGSGQIVGNSFVGGSGVNDYALRWESGGADMYTSNSFLGSGANQCVWLNTSLETTLGPWFANNDNEGCAIGYRFTANTSLTAASITGGNIFATSIAVNIDSATSGTVNFSKMTGVTVTGPAVCINIDRSTGFQALGNMCSLNSTSFAYGVAAGATGTVIKPGVTNNATSLISDAGAGTSIDAPATTTVAALPASAAGSVLYVSDANPGTAPCTAGGAGAIAVRLPSGSWRCEASAFTGSGNYVLASSSTQANPTFTGSFTATGLVTNAALANMANARIKCRTTSGTGVPEDCTVAQLKALSGFLAGTTTNDSAAAGDIGEQIISTVASGSAVSLTTNTPANVTSISLTAGDWDVSGNIGYTAGGSTVVSILIGGINTTSATLPTAPNGGYYLWTGGLTGGAPWSPIVPTRLSLSSTTTVYLVTQGTFTTSTLTAYGVLRARRMR